MQFLYDNIVASIVAGTVLLMMVVVQHRNNIAAAEATSFYMLQKQVLDFTGVIQRDMQNASAFQDLEEDETDSTFSFLAQTDVADTTKHLVTYRRRQVGYRHFNGVTVPLYEIERSVDGVVNGGSPASVVSWELRVLNEEGNPATDVADAMQVRVATTVAAPMAVHDKESASIPGTRWEAVFRPRLLRDEQL